MASRDFVFTVYVPKSPAERKIENEKKKTQSKRKKLRDCKMQIYRGHVTWRQSKKETGSGELAGRRQRIQLLLEYLNGSASVPAPR